MSEGASWGRIWTKELLVGQTRRVPTAVRLVLVGGQCVKAYLGEKTVSGNRGKYRREMD